MENRLDDNLINSSKSNTEKINSDLFYRSLFENSPDILFFIDLQGIIAKINDGFLDILGYSNDEVVLSSMKRFLPASEIPLYKELFINILSGQTQHFNTLFLHKTGKTLPVRVVGLPALVDNQVIGVFVVAVDISEQMNLEIELNQTEKLFSSMVEQAFIGVYIIEQYGQISYGNRKLYQILGLEFKEDLNFLDYIHPEDLLNQKDIFSTLTNGEDGVDHSFRMIQKDGTIIDVEAHSKKVYLVNNRPTIIGALRDVTERKRAEDLNKYLAYHDPLTELPNLRFIYEKMDHELLISKTLQQKVAVMIIDLDRFKYVNDTFGHSLGDKLLKQVSTRLHNCLGGHDVLARLGGDEFGVLLPNILNTQQVIELAVTMIKSLEEPFHIEKYELFITASIGISIFPNDGEDRETILKHADSALYKAKERGKNTYQIFTSSLDAEAYKIFTLESDLRKALELDQLELYYQPKVCATTNQIIGAEALIRWNHPEWGIVSPGEFIPLAEETGLITEINEWVKYTACSQNKAWQDAELPAIPVSINLSASQFLEKDLFNNIVEILDKTKLNPNYLEIEILETSLLENEKVVFSILDKLKNIGVRISMDDFGTGYSSLSYLKRFKGKIDTLKIDRSFISGLNPIDEEDTNFITKTIIQLAQHLHMDVVAEGVETVEQLNILKEYNCNNIQGYLFSKPVPANEFAILLQKRKIDTPTDSIEDKTIVKQERRNYFRIQLDFPLGASMTLTRIHGRPIELGRTDVLIENIGLGGLRFLSDMRLAVQRDIILEIETEILGHSIKMYGSIVWMKEIKPSIYQYGLEFSMDESERPVLTQLLNKLAILLRKNPLVPDCNFVTTDRYSFFKKNREVKE